MSSDRLRNIISKNAHKKRDVVASTEPSPDCPGVIATVA
jgi:hypothetical protein